MSAQGYAVLTEPVMAALTLAARTEGSILDPIYTGRALAGLMSAVAEGEIKPGRTHRPPAQRWAPRPVRSSPAPSHAPVGGLGGVLVSTARAGFGALSGRSLDRRFSEPVGECAFDMEGAPVLRQAADRRRP